MKDAAAPAMKKVMKDDAAPAIKKAMKDVAAPAMKKAMKFESEVEFMSILQGVIRQVEVDVSRGMYLD